MKKFNLRWDLILQFREDHHLILGSLDRIKKLFTFGIDIGRADCTYESLRLLENDDFDNEKEPEDSLIVIVGSRHIVVFKNYR